MTPFVQPEANARFVKHVGRFVGCLAVSFVSLDKKGNGVGDPATHTYSGFFIKVDGHWFFVTAGHVFIREDGDTDEHGNQLLGLQQAIAKKLIRIVGCSLIDYIGENATTPTPTILDYDSVLENTVFINQSAFGLDFAFMPLRELYVKGVSASGVIPFEEPNWQPVETAMSHYVVGFPDELKTQLPYSDGHIKGLLELRGFEVTKCDLPPSIPVPSYPFFAAKLVDTGLISAVGLSGSPIIAVNVLVAQKQTTYTLVGIDSGWHKSERIIVGCPMYYVVALFRNLMKPRNQRRPASQTD